MKQNRPNWMKPGVRVFRLALLITLLIDLGWVGSARAQEGRLRFERLTVQEGLAHNTVYAGLQDRLGFLWFATEEGLDKYDGLTFTPYQHDPQDPSSLGDNRVLALYEDTRGTLWIGTEKGLDRFERQDETFTHVLPCGERRLAVQALAEDGQGKVWAGTAGQGVWVFDLETGAVEQLIHDPQAPDSLAGNQVYALLLSRDGSLWVGTDGGLERYDPASGRFLHYPHQTSNPNSPTSSRVLALFEDHNGALWIGTDGGGLNRFDTGRSVFSFYLHSSVDRNSLVDNRVQAILEDQVGDLWIGTPVGLDRLDPATGRFSHYQHNPRDPQSLSGSQVLCLFEDRSGGVWAGTRRGGLSQFKRSAHKFSLYQASPLLPEGLSGSAVGPILEDRSGQLWVGTLEAGLDLLDRQAGTWTTYRHDPGDPTSLGSDFVTALLQDRAGKFWIGLADRGLDSFDPATGHFTHYRNVYGDPNSLASNLVTSLAEDEAGNLWVGLLDTGVDRLDPATGCFTHYRSTPPGSSQEDVTALYLGLDGSLWIGTYSGSLIRWDPQTDTIQPYPSQSRYKSNSQVFSLWEQPRGVIWIGTRDGLDRLDLAQDRLQRYSTRDGLPASTVTGILGDMKDELWISTTNGLARFDLQGETIHSYTVADGLQSQEFTPGSAYRSPVGELFFGGVQGFNAFFPSQVRDMTNPPPVVITALKKQNQLVAKDLVGNEPLQLSYRDTFISFEFAALDYNAPQENQFAYQLEGFDPNWVLSGRRNFASYTNLKGGQYTFRLKAANSDGVWNETGIAIPVTITPPVWETGWFRGLALTGLVVGVYGSYRWRVRSIQRRNQELERRVAELSRQVEEAAVAAERNRLARDLHDSVTQSLYSLTLMAEAGQRLLEAGELGECRQNQRRLSEIAQQALQDMRLLVYELRPPELGKTGLVGALEHRIEAVERRAGVQARLIVERQPQLAPQVEEELYMLAQEALNNALKHAGTYGVTVRLGEQDGRLWLEIRDTGRGFDPALVRQGGLGLVSMRERAEKLGGRLEVHSVPGEGTCVRFSMSKETSFSTG